MKKLEIRRIIVLLLLIISITFITLSINRFKNIKLHFSKNYKHTNGSIIDKRIENDRYFIKVKYEVTTFIKKGDNYLNSKLEYPIGESELSKDSKLIEEAKEKLLELERKRRKNEDKDEDNDETGSLTEIMKKQLNQRQYYTYDLESSIEVSSIKEYDKYKIGDEISIGYLIMFPSDPTIYSNPIKLFVLIFLSILFAGLTIFMFIKTNIDIKKALNDSN